MILTTCANGMSASYCNGVIGMAVNALEVSSWISRGHGWMNHDACSLPMLVSMHVEIHKTKDESRKCPSPLFHAVRSQALYLSFKL
jgi:hypothetical protein